MSSHSIKLDDEKVDLDILFAGDFGPMGVVENDIIRNNQPDIHIDLKDYLQNKDLFVANLECPITTSETKIKKAGPSLKAIPQCISFINQCSIDILNLSNNHIMDYGAKGLNDTFNLLKDNTPCFGAGKNIAEAKAPFRIEKKGIKVSFMSYCENVFNIATAEKAGCAPIDPVDIMERIQHEKRESDHVILSLHVGSEYYPLPGPKLKSICHKFVDYGASAIICHHSHVIGGYEIYNGVPIFYGLGNFIFDFFTRRKRPKSYEGLLVKIGFNKFKPLKLELIPFIFNREKVKLFQLDNDHFNQFLDRMNKLRDIIQHGSVFLSMWSLYAGEIYYYYLSSRLRKARSYIWLSKEKRYRFLWFIRVNETHSEVVETALKDLADGRPKISGKHKKLYRELMGEISLYTKIKRIVRLII